MSDTMYGYKVYIWQTVYHNGECSHVNRRVRTIRLPTARRSDQYRLRKMVRPLLSLKPATESRVHDGFTVSTDEEFIYSVEYLGRAVARIVYDYEEDSNV